MPIVVNGTTIPENVANALNVNGTNITSVVCNGTTVWTQSLFNATWSGSSVTGNPCLVYGLVNSGSTYQYRANSLYGTICSVSTSGIFSGNSLAASTLGVSVSSNLIRSYNQGLYGGWVTFTLATKAFSGSSYVWKDDGEGGFCITLETSGGLLRTGYGGSTAIACYGGYVSLT